MKKLLTVLAIATVVSFSASAQKGEHPSPAGNSSPALSVGFEAGLSTGDLSTTQKAGFGASVKYAQPVMEGGAVTVSVGYMSFAGKSFLGIKVPAWNAVPAKVGFRYTIKGSGFNIEPQIGYTFGSVSGSSSKDASGFTWAIGAGYFFTPNIDLGIRYESTSVTGASLNFVGLRIAYNFNLGGKK